MSIDLRCKHGRMVRELAAAHGLMLDRESRFPPVSFSALPAYIPFWWNCVPGASRERGVR